MRDASGDQLDADSRYVDVPGQTEVGSETTATLWTQTMRRGSWSEVVKAAMEPNATPTATRTFGRREYLLIRAHTFGRKDVAGELTASVFNRAGRPLRQLERLSDLLEPEAVQFALPLAWLPPDAYQVQVRGTDALDRARDQVKFCLVD